MSRRDQCTIPRDIDGNMIVDAKPVTVSKARPALSYRAARRNAAFGRRSQGNGNPFPRFPFVRLSGANHK